MKRAVADVGRGNDASFDCSRGMRILTRVQSCALWIEGEYNGRSNGCNEQ